MKNRKTRSAMRRMLFTLALVLVVAVASVGGTIAWLTATTAPVTNTFTVGNINIELKETLKPDGTALAANEKWEAKLIPGTEYFKNPKVTVKGGSEDCWLFVKVTEPALTGVLTYNLKTEGWTKGTGDGENGNGVPTDVYYREVPYSATDTSFELLTNNKVSIANTVTKDQIDTLDKTKKYEMTFQAYAIQKEGSANAAAAWAKLNPGT
ncbi:MAG: hypothetical protein PUD68_00680 [Clostridiales bacterium]|nr:hypothetical protein [Clostridiales bacterium]